MLLQNVVNVLCGVWLWLIFLSLCVLLVNVGPVWQDNKPTGFGVKLLVDYLLNVKKAK